MVIDPTTWTIDKAYVHQNEGWSAVFDGDKYHYWKRSFHAAGKYCALTWENRFDASSPHILVINLETQVSWEYHFNTQYGTTQNVNYTWQLTSDILPGQMTPWIDERNNRLYLVRHGFRSGRMDWEVAWTDLTETPSLGYYTFNYLTHDPVPNNSDGGQASYVSFFPDENRFIIASRMNTSLSFRGHIYVSRIDTGALVKEYNGDDWSDMWFWGVGSWPVIHDNKIYAPINYSTDQSQEDRRGMMIVDMDDDTFSYSRPTYNSSLDNYKLYDAQLIINFYKSGTGNNTILFASTNDDPDGGVVLYDINTGKWELWNSDNVDCFLTIDQVHAVGYDSTRGLIAIGNEQYYVGDPASSEEVRFF